MLFRYQEHGIEHNPYFRDATEFPYAPVPKYEQLYPQFPAPPQYTNGEAQTNGANLEDMGQNQQGQTMESYYGQQYTYPLPYPVQSQEEGYGSQSYYSHSQQSYGNDYYPQSSMPHSNYGWNISEMPKGPMPQYGPFTPYPQSTKNQQKQPSTVGNFLSQFKNTNGDIDVNKMMNTAGTMMNAFSQLGGLAKQVGGFFIK
ncbi:MAG: YppG family protein [Bacillaceae bacterium]